MTSVLLLGLHRIRWIAGWIKLHLMTNVLGRKYKKWSVSNIEYYTCQWKIA